MSANPGNHLKERLIALIEKYPKVPIAFLGIPTINGTDMVDWTQQPVWR